MRSPVCADPLRATLGSIGRPHHVDSAPKADRRSTRNSMKTKWTQARLEKLFARYNRRYWRGRLPSYSVAPGRLDGSVGLCDRAERRITIDLRAHPSDAAVRDTLLHEIAHAADTTGNPVAHGRGFWAQVERLLRQGAPINVGHSELPGIPPLVDSVPREFHLCRAALQKLAAVTMRSIPQDTPVSDIDEREILVAFSDAAALDGMDWAAALRAVGGKNGLLDVDLRPQQTAWVTRVLRKARRAHLEGEDSYLIGMLSDALYKAGGLSLDPEAADIRRCTSMLRDMRRGEVKAARSYLLGIGVPPRVVSVIEAKLRPDPSAR